MFSWQKQGKLEYLGIDEFMQYGVKAYFTSRLGGVSTDIYSSLNMGLNCGDKPTTVLQNRRLVAEALNINHQNLVAGEQVHSNKVYIVDKRDIGRGALNYKNSIPGVDALITVKKGIPLISFYADCVPAFFMDPEKKVIALAHAGWRGTVNKIIVKTISKMKEVYGIKTQDLWVAIGPSISKDFYEVDSKVASFFKSSFEDWREFITNKGNGFYLLDLKLANKLLLKEAGILEEKIIISDYCTYKDNKLFYSYRKERGKTGRMASIIYW